MVLAEYWNEGEGEDEVDDGVVNYIEHCESGDGSTVGDTSDWVSYTEPEHPTISLASYLSSLVHLG